MEPKDLMEQLKSLCGDMKDNSAHATKAVEDLRTEVETQTVTVTDEFAGLKKRIDAIETKTADPRKVGYALPGMTEKDVEKWSWRRAMLGIAREVRGWGETKAWDGCSHERDILFQTREDMAKAGHQESIDEHGGYFVPAQIVADFIELLRAELVLTELGVTNLTGLSGTPVPIPEQTAGSTFQFIGENGIPSESKLSFGTVKLEPKRLAGFTTVSNRLLTMASRSIEDMIKGDMVSGAARAAELGFLFGNGGVEPLGLFNIAGITHGQLNPGVGRRWDYDDAEIQRLAIQVANVPGDVAFLTRPEIISLLRRRKVDHFAGQTVNQAYVSGAPLISDAELKNRILGDFKTSTALPDPTPIAAPIANTSPAIAGVWKNFVLGFWKTMTIRASREASLGNRSSFLQNETWWIIEMEGDCNVRRKNAFHIFDDALTV